MALSFDSSAAEWSSQFVEPLLDWYNAHRRQLPWREDVTPYRVWISEIMLQQTQVGPAIPYFTRFLRQLPNVASLAECDADKLNKLWEGLGYYSRVRNLQKAARLLLLEYNGRFPQTIKELTRLPGIGDYTAGAILSIAFSLPVPAVDGNALRVFSRVGAFEQDIGLAQSKKAVTALAAQCIPSTRPGDFNQALMDLGATVCRAHGEPLCGCCPERMCCAAQCGGLTGRLPVRSPKPKRRSEERTVLLFVSPQGVLLRHRPKTGLLAGLWEYPNLEGQREKGEIEEILLCAGIKGVISALAPAHHVFTHLEWRMTGHLIHCAPFPAAEAEVWATPAALGQIYAVPSAFKSYTALLLRLFGENGDTISPFLPSLHGENLG